MKKMRNILTLVIAFSLVFASCRYVNAADKEEGNDTVLSKLENVPFYVTVTDEMEESSVKDTIASVIRSHKNQKSILDYQDEHCIIREIPKCRHQDMLNNVLYGGQIRRAAAMVDQGIEVEYINFFVNNETIAQSLVNSYPTRDWDQNDPTAWENNCSYFGYYKCGFQRHELKHYRRR